MKSSTLCFVAGKSGGHILPCLAQAHEYIGQNPHNRVLFFTTTAPLDKKLLADQPAAIKVIYMPLGQFPYKKFWRYPRFIVNFMRACMQAAIALYHHKPTTIISMGGSTSLPVAGAGIFLRIPLHLYELNVVPGKTIKALAPFAQKIFICFEQTKKYLSRYSCSVTAYPLRTALDTIEPYEAPAGKKLLVIIGGSQGSQSINALMQEFIQQHPELKNCSEIIHQTGSDAAAAELQKFYTKHGFSAHAFAFDNQIARFYKNADLIICRSGAGTLFEIVQYKKRCITIPLITASNNHQWYNARAMAENYPFITMKTHKEIEQNKDQFFKEIAATISA